ncbi:MAG: hypothetical protein R3A78_00855 [Polyangiales bacterium]|nr:hypothetical protein [Myxococcales bacterium]
MRAPILLVSALTLAGCMLQNQSPTTKFRDQVQGLNEEARWNRLDLAQGRTTRRYQPKFSALRGTWGKRLQLGDHDVVQLVMDTENDSAVSVVQIAWYNLADMTLRSSTIRQVWLETKSGFALDDEQVVDGDPTIFDALDDASAAHDSPKGAKSAPSKPGAVD